ncbi:hypothetical protein N0V85_004969 [Neurospora sp. IMI 360204]|nr:hypothetical protein N0V85_004969 [Neurospora sp. IMI 360204]
MPPKRGAAKGAAKKLVPDKLRRDNNNFYHFYRKGELRENARRKVKLASQRENLLLSHGVVPDEVFPMKTNEGLQGYDEYYAELAEESENEERDKKPAKDKKVEKEKWETSKGLTKDMYEKGAGLHFCKILGAGSMGIICVFVSYDENQTPTFWTVKRDIKPYQTVTTEKETTLRFLRAPHIVQVFHRYKEEDSDDGSPLPPRRSKRARTERSQAEVRKESRAARAGQRVASIARKAGTAVRQPQVGPTDQIDQVPDSMVMEYVIRGTLDNWFEGLGKLKAASEPDLVIPNRVLWDMMACFMKMCIAMEYHPLRVNIMHIAITLRWNPSLTIHALRDEDLIYGPPNDLPLRRQTKRSYPTYGAHLLDPQYDHVPFRLRHLVARCLCEIPDDRPSFEEIRAEIQWAWDRESPEEREAARQWSQARFEKPPPPVTPPWMKVEEWAKQNAILSFDEFLEKHPVK